MAWFVPGKDKAGGRFARRPFPALSEWIFWAGATSDTVLIAARGLWNRPRWRMAKNAGEY